jgi:Spy/CpxP family protein refolding chaperone
MLRKIALRKIVYGMIVLIFFATPVLATAQDMMPGKWWYNPQISKELNLNQDEKESLEQSFRDSRRNLIGIKSRVEREQFELDNLLEDEKMDEEAIKKQFKKLESERAKLSEERFNFIMKIRSIVGKERFQKMKLFHETARRDKSKRYMGNSRHPQSPKK